MNDSPSVDRSDFYVGYLAMPRRLAGFLRWIVPAAGVAVLALGWFAAASQSDPGDGVWRDAAQSLVGRVSATPYPLIRVRSDGGARPVETVLLVSEGKHGGGERVAALHGRIARVRGTILERDGRRLLELADGDALAPVEAVSVDDGARLTESAASGSTSLGRVMLRGEIIDPKCYSGAMKPGEGKAHKECATLCIAGGIPPMFVTLDSAGKRTYFLLVDADGHALEGRVLQDHVLPFVADAVEITGELEIQEDLAVLRIDALSIRRL